MCGVNSSEYAILLFCETYLVFGECHAPSTLKTIYSNEHKFVLSVTQESITLPQHMSSSRILVGFVLFYFLVFCVMFCGSLFVLLSFFFWLLHCLSFFDLWLLMTLLSSSNCSSSGS